MYTEEWVKNSHRKIITLPPDNLHKVLLFMLGYMNGSVGVDGYVAFMEGLDTALIEYQGEIDVTANAG